MFITKTKPLYENAIEYVSNIDKNKAKQIYLVSGLLASNLVYSANVYHYLYGSGTHKTHMKGFQSMFADTSGVKCYSTIQEDAGDTFKIMLTFINIGIKSSIYGFISPVLWIEIILGHNSPYYFNWQQKP